MWVSGNTNTRGNDVADELVRQAADMYFIGPEAFFGVPKRQLKRELKDWEAKKWHPSGGKHPNKHMQRNMSTARQIVLKY